MKNFLFSFLTCIILSGCVILGGIQNGRGEVYEGTAQGYRGPISVQVYMNGGSITDIFIIDSLEDSFIGGAAIEELLNLVIAYNTTDLDAISGATESSKGFLEAVENAILGR